MRDRRRTVALVGCLLALATASPSGAASWSNTELHLQAGKLDTPTFAGGGDKNTTILTLQHASGWKYGDNFFFFDAIKSEGGGFNDNEVYGELYSYLSPRKMAGKEEMKGVLRDVRIVAGFNWAPDADVVKYLPGVGLSWNVKGFAYLNTDITLYIDDSVGAADGGAPRQDDSFMIDVSWARPIDKRFSIEGHVEYIGERTDEFGQTVEAWFQAQPQFRWYFVENAALGIEYQYWMNKLGDDDTDESAVQALLVWRF